MFPVKAGWNRACVAASNPEASLMSVGSPNAVPRELIPMGPSTLAAGTCTMGYPGPPASPAGEDEVVGEDQIGGPARAVGRRHHRVEVELVERCVDAVHARMTLTLSVSDRRVSTSSPDLPRVRMATGRARHEYLGARRGSAQVPGSGSQGVQFFPAGPKTSTLPSRRSISMKMLLPLRCFGTGKV